MANSKPSVTVHEPFLGQPLDAATADPALVAAASREAGQREMSMIEWLNRGGTLTHQRPQLPQRSPLLPDDHAEQLEKLDRAIYDRGVAIDRNKLLSLGKLRFTQLLAADRVGRAERILGPRIDLSSFSSVFFAFAQSGALQQLPVPEATMHEQLCGLDAELDRARKIESFADLWKLFGSEPRAIKAIYAFRDVFESLIFGQSMLERLSNDGRLRSKLLCGGSNEKVCYFEAWLPALKGPHHCVKIANALAATVFWLSGEKSAPPDARDLAREWFGLRLPSPEQITLANAILEGWLSNRKGWSLWEFVGRQIRRLPDQFLVKHWSDELRARFRRIEVFHGQVAACFYAPRGDHREFEPVKHQQFVKRTIDQLLNCVCAVAALTIEENSPRDSAVVVARFRDWILCSGKPKAQITERIAAKLAATFPGSAFKVEATG